MQVIFSNYYIDWIWVFEDIYQEIIDLQKETRLRFSVLIKARLKTLHTVTRVLPLLIGSHISQELSSIKVYYANENFSVAQAPNITIILNSLLLNDIYLTS